MNQIILASHGGMAAGVRDTLSMVLGEVPNVHVVSLARDDKEPITKSVEALLASFDEQDAVYVLTDMLGSSVNNSMVELMKTTGRITVISGMNMPLALALAVTTEPVRGDALVEVIRESRRGIRDCAAPDKPAAPRHAAPAGTPAGFRGGPANIALVRLDYRLLHGQVVFTWVSACNAERIIVVDNTAANDEVKKGALKLAKPAGVRLNVFTVERALSKMDKLNTLGENVMFVFGNTRELLEFSRVHPFPEVNFGATANHDGAEQVGGQESSVFLDAAEKADANELMRLGTKIFVQQTPTYKRVDLTSEL